MSDKYNDYDIPIKKEDGSAFKILLVDDSLFVVKQLTQILTSAGYEIAGTGSNGIEGVDQYKALKDNIDLVTLDITMPKMDGLTCLEKILEFDKTAKVIMVSAIGKGDLVKKAIVTGAKNYVVKPLDRKKVLERIKSALT